MFINHKLKIWASFLIIAAATTSTGYAEGVVVVPLGGTDYEVVPPIELIGPGKNTINLSETGIIQPSQNVAFIIKINGPLPPNTLSGGPDADTPFVGQIVMWAGTYPPKGWAFADGQVVPTSSFPQLFSVLGNNYGNVGPGLFKLPDLRGRVPIHFGNGPGLSNRIIGVQHGAETIGNSGL